MPVTLPESTRLRKRQLSGFAPSVFAHAVALAALLANNGLTAPPRSLASERTLPVYSKPDVADPSAANRAHTTAAAAPSTAPDLPRIDVPSIVLPRLPEIPLGERAFDTLAFERRRFSGDPTRGPVVAGPEAPFDWRMVDRQVEPRVANPVPRYPTALISAGVEGSVTIRFVVDTFGVVERGSAVAVRSSHPLFEQAVRDVLRLMRFVPAEAGGRKVRQLVEQSFQFEIRR